MLERPWKASEALSAVVLHFATERKPIMQRIRNSDYFSHIYQAAVKRMRGWDGVKNLSNALHRFDSVIRPLVRLGS